jgi:molybdenum cofactor cytidylyltransferase
MKMKAEGAGITVAVLAAGASRRLGRNKLLLDLGGESVVRRAVRAAVEAAVGPVLVVLGHEPQQVLDELSGLPITPVLNPVYEEGMGSSLRAGVKAAFDSKAVVIALADMPLVEGRMIAALAARHHETGAPVVLSRYGSIQAPPTLYDRRLFIELLGTPDARGAREAADRHSAEAAVVSWPEALLRDLDLEVDYEELKRITRG